MYTSKCKLWLADHDDSVYESIIVIHSMSVKRRQEVNTVTHFLKELSPQHTNYTGCMSVHYSLPKTFKIAVCYGFMLGN